MLMTPTEQIERELGIMIECEPTGDEERRKFTDKTQDELIELLIRAQVGAHSVLPFCFLSLPLKYKSRGIKLTGKG